MCSLRSFSLFPLCKVHLFNSFKCHSTHIYFRVSPLFSKYGFFLSLISTMPSRLSDAFRAHPQQQLKHPDFTSLHELPDSYAWNQRDDPSPEAFAIESVPLVDLNDPNALQGIGHACKTWGLFQVTNHGISTNLLDMVEHTCRSLFSLPVHQKLKAARSPDGVSGYGFARISSFFSKLMWSEGFTIIGPPDEHFRQLWPQDFSYHW